MNYLEIVQTVRKFPALSDVDVVSVLQHIDTLNKPLKTDTKVYKTSGELLINQKIQYRGQASTGLTEYLKQHGFKPRRFTDNGVWHWELTPRLEQFVGLWLQEDGYKFLT